MIEDNSRRSFIGNTIKAAAIVSLGGVMFSCKGKDDDNEKHVSPPEDLMQEHGLLNRILLIYDKSIADAATKLGIQNMQLYNAAGILRTFVEDYHERQEEQYLFPRFQKANQLTDLVSTLLQQHNAGRALTDQILQLSKGSSLTQADTQKLVSLLTRFNIMYRPHEAREDTILFPAFRKLVSNHEYDSLGEEFEKNETKKFGKDGFESVLAKVADIEKALGIYELAQFTPQV